VVLQHNRQVRRSRGGLVEAEAIKDVVVDVSLDKRGRA
jgi:hypothetical protein